MSLFSTLQIASNSLISTSVGLQVVGNNIANANTPGYTRQDVIYIPAATQLVGTLPLGLGVQIQGIIQQTDRFVTERLRGAVSDVENTESQKQTYLKLEAIIGELTDTDLSSSLDRFFCLDPRRAQPTRRSGHSKSGRTPRPAADSRYRAV